MFLRLTISANWGDLPYYVTTNLAVPSRHHCSTTSALPYRIQPSIHTIARTTTILLAYTRAARAYGLPVYIVDIPALPVSLRSVHYCTATRCDSPHLCACAPACAWTEHCSHHLRCTTLPSISSPSTGRLCHAIGSFCAAPCSIPSTYHLL